MIVDRADAAAALTAIGDAERETTRAIVYGIASSYLILWGVVTMTGYVADDIKPQYAWIIWLVLDGIGFAATIWISIRNKTGVRPDQKILARKLLAAQFVLVVFAILVTNIMQPLTARQIGAFVPLVFMLGYVLAGLWFGRFFILCGAVIAVLTLAVFWWAGPWFSLDMAMVSGGVLIFSGLWLRRVGASL